jgi:hypothetical protein
VSILDRGRSHTEAQDQLLAVSKEKKKRERKGHAEMRLESRFVSADLSLVGPRERKGKKRERKGEEKDMQRCSWGRASKRKGKGHAEMRLGSRFVSADLSLVGPRERKEKRKRHVGQKSRRKSPSFGRDFLAFVDRSR